MHFACYIHVTCAILSYITKLSSFATSEVGTIACFQQTQFLSFTDLN